VFSSYTEILIDLKDAKSSKCSHKTAPKAADIHLNRLPKAAGAENFETR
jgi:hypothetical protein